MHKQGLRGSSQAEVLTVRWSNEDPNPISIVRHKRACEESFAQVGGDRAGLGAEWVGLG